LPAGSFYTEPAKIPHFVAINDDGAVIEISGTGPSSQLWVDPAHAPTKKQLLMRYAKGGAGGIKL